MIKSIFSSLIFLLAAACSTPSKARDKPLALVSIGPYQLLVERVAGDYLDVLTVVPSSANPHSFEPTARQVTELAKGSIWFRIGEPFEEKILPIISAKNPDFLELDLRVGIDLIPESEGLSCHHCAMEHLDRHIWMSPKLAAVQVEQIMKALSDRFPEQAGNFQTNGARLIEELLALDAEIEALLKPVEKRQLLVSHPAFGYFCRDYGIEQISVEYEGKDPRPHHLEEILKQAVENSLDFTLALPQYNNKGAQIIAERLHVPVKWIDPYSKNYFEMMRHLAELIAESNE